MLRRKFPTFCTEEAWES